MSTVSWAWWPCLWSEHWGASDREISNSRATRGRPTVARPLGLKELWVEPISWRSVTNIILRKETESKKETRRHSCPVVGRAGSWLYPAAVALGSSPGVSSAVLVPESSESMGCGDYECNCAAFHDQETPGDPDSVYGCWTATRPTFSFPLFHHSPFKAQGQVTWAISLGHY